MKNFNWKNILPWGMLMPFFLLIGFEYLVDFGLTFYNKRLNNEISLLESSLTQKEEALMQTLKTNEAFYVFSQIANIVEIVKNRASVNYVIDKFNKIMPNFLIINEFEFNAETNEIKIRGAVNSWSDYVRFHSYLTNLSDIELKSFESPKLEKNLINFSMVLLLKPSFYRE